MTPPTGSFRPSAPEDLPRIFDLLQRAFGATGAPASRELMNWKYWQPRSDWNDPRSYVLEKGGELIAHAGIWPVVFPHPERPLRGIQMIDWAAAPDSPGAGATLVQKLSQSCDFIYSIGGSEATRRVLPAFGFKEVARAWTGARPLRPWRQIRTHQATGWKLLPRLARNTLWSITGGGRATGDWTAAEVSPQALPVEFTDDYRQSPFSPRGRAFFEYLASCPAVRFRIFEIRREQTSAGHFVLALLRGQARLAGVWLRNPAPEMWEIAFTLAQRIAREWPGAYEFAAAGSMGPSADAAVKCGVRVLRQAPVFLLDRKKAVRLPDHFQFQMADDDAAFLDPGQPAYLS